MDPILAPFDCEYENDVCDAQLGTIEWLSGCSGPAGYQKAFQCHLPGGGGYIDTGFCLSAGALCDSVADESPNGARLLASEGFRR